VVVAVAVVIVVVVVALFLNMAERHAVEWIDLIQQSKPCTKTQDG